MRHTSSLTLWPKLDIFVHGISFGLLPVQPKKHSSYKPKPTTTTSPVLFPPTSFHSSTLCPGHCGGVNRSLTAPDKMEVNGHFESAHQNGKVADFEHGVQIIDEDKEFKYAPPGLSRGAADEQ